MNIKEMEGKTGMTRANIRYYEAEGLIFPSAGRTATGNTRKPIVKSC